MFKMIILLRKKEGMTHEDFVEYYENQHVVLAGKLAPRMRRHIRNYLTPVDNDEYDSDRSDRIDCITEVFFDDESDFESTIADFENSDKMGIIISDEEKVFDRASIRWFKTVVNETELNRS